MHLSTDVMMENPSENTNADSKRSRLIIEGRYNGPANSGNGGYVCGRLANFVGGVATVRLRVPPPLNTPLEVSQEGDKVRFLRNDALIAEGWPSKLDIDVPSPPSLEESGRASQLFRGFDSHRFPSCFVCGIKREKGDGLQIFAGPVEGRNVVACVWIPSASLAHEDLTVRPEFVWAALDCPGGYAFPEPSKGTILLGELTVQLLSPVRAGLHYVVMAWEISQDGRKHHTGSALFSPDGLCCGKGRGVWFEVPELE